MTLEEFTKTRFGNGDAAKNKYGTFPIAQVDFEECLLGLLMEIPGSETGDISWVRCENVEYIPSSRPL
jgi:hypothetical protein